MIFIVIDTASKQVKRWAHGASGAAGAAGAGETEVSQAGSLPLADETEILEWDDVSAVVMRAETLAEMKARLIVGVEAHHMDVTEGLEVTHDAKQWRARPHDQVEWVILEGDSGGLSYPHDVFAKTEAATVADAAEITTIRGLIDDEIRTEDQACIDAKHSVNDAADEAAAQAAYDAYVGS